MTAETTPAVEPTELDATTPASPAGAAPPPVVKTAEAWALEKKHSMAQQRNGEKPAAVPDWRFAAAKAHEGWPTGKELTEADYDAAVARAIGAPLR